MLTAFCLVLCLFIYVTMFDLAIQADAGSSGAGSGGRKYNAPQPGAETFQMKIANNKVCTLLNLDKGLPYHTKNISINNQYCGDCLINVIFSSASDVCLSF